MTKRCRADSSRTQPHRGEAQPNQFTEFTEFEKGMEGTAPSVPTFSAPAVPEPGRGMRHPADATGPALRLGPSREPTERFPPSWNGRWRLGRVDGFAGRSGAVRPAGFFWFFFPDDQRQTEALVLRGDLACRAEHRSIDLLDKFARELAFAARCGGWSHSQSASEWSARLLTTLPRDGDGAKWRRIVQPREREEGKARRNYFDSDRTFV